MNNVAALIEGTNITVSIPFNLFLQYLDQRPRRASTSRRRLSDKDKWLAYQLLKVGNCSVSAVADSFGVSRMTVHRIRQKLEAAQ